MKLVTEPARDWVRMVVRPALVSYCLSVVVVDNLRLAMGLTGARTFVAAGVADSFVGCNLAVVVLVQQLTSSAQAPPA